MSEKKKEFGQFFTPPKIAEFMVNLAVENETQTLLDPAVGKGVFVDYAHRKNKNAAITVHEIDPEMVINYRQSINFPTELKEGDYLKADEKLYDAIICNPPYNKFQEIADRYEYIRRFEENYNIKLSGYSNLCVYFLVKSLHELKENGRCVYIIPYEFLNAGYGNNVKSLFLEKKTLKSIYKFNNDLNLFSDAITTSCIMVFENSPHERIDFISIDSVDEIETMKFSSSISVAYKDIDPSKKWNIYFSSNKPSFDCLIPFKKTAKVKRGIATGNNSFFALSESQINELNLSRRTCIRCISKSPDIKESVFTDEVFERLSASDKKVYLFDGEKAESESDFSYIKYGENIGVNKSYLNSHRNPWYQIENKETAPIWISVFSRDKLKVVRNETNSKNLTTFHGIYMEKDYEKYTDIFFCYLLTPIAQKILYNNKREYGDGLDKFEPNDLNNAFVLDMKKIADDDLKSIESLYESLKSKTNSNSVISELNGIFQKYIAN